MEHLAYYNTGCEPEPGLSRSKLWVRRQLRKILLPASKRMVQILGSLCHRLEVSEAEIRALRNEFDDLRHRQHDLASKFPATVAFGWDYVAMIRRLAALEEHVDSLLVAREAAEGNVILGSGSAESLPAVVARESAA